MNASRHKHIYNIIMSVYKANSNLTHTKIKSSKSIFMNISETKVVQQLICIENSFEKVVQNVNFNNIS